MKGRALCSRSLAGFAFALLVVPLSAQEPPAPAAVEAVVQRFYSAYATGDLNALLELWDRRSPSLPEFRDEVAPFLRVRCMRLYNLTFDSLEVAGDHATANVHVLLSKRGRTMPERYDPHSAMLELVHKEGRWLVTRWTLRERAVVDRLLAARSDAERQTLLEAEPRLLTPALGRALARRGVLALNQQRFEEAAMLTRLVRNVASAIGDPAGLSLATGIDCLLNRALPGPRLAASLDLGYRSVAFAEESTDPDAIARASFRIGKTFYALGRGDMALPWFERAFALRDDIEDDSIVSLVAGQLAAIYSDRGDHHASMHYSEIARATAKDDFARAGAEMNLGGEYANGEGDGRLAIPHLLRALELARRAGFRDGIPGVSWMLANCYLQVGQGEEALRVVNESLADCRLIPHSQDVPSLLLVRSRYFTLTGRLARAQADLFEALRLAREVKSTGAEIDALTELAAHCLRQGRYKAARATAAQANALAMGFDPAPLLIQARSERHLGRREVAYRILRRLVDATEESAAAVISDEHARQTFFESRAGAYLELADMLVEDRRFNEALVIAERSKGRLLLDVLRGGKLLQYGALSPSERDNETALERSVAVLNMRSAASPTDEEKIAQPLREARRKLEDYRADLCSKHPRLSQHATPAVLSLHDTSALLPDSSSAFVEYFVTDTRLVIFVVTGGRGGALHVHLVPVTRRRLERETGALVRALAERDLLFRGRSRRLYDVILGAAAAELKGVTTIGIIPDGPLWQLPFESLVMPDGRFVIERMACFYAPSIAVYREMVRNDRPRPSGNFLAFANPTPHKGEEVAEAKLRDSEAGSLPDAEREVERSARFFRDGTRVYVGADALESRAKSESSEYDVVHFATHGVLDDNNPMYSHLLLATAPDSPEDGFLETWELMRLDLHAELAVLSACDTARGTVHAGEGLIGMSWALFVAGSSSTVVTQWKVPSAAGADLMIDFYRQWLQARRDHTWFAKAEALRLARLHLLRDGKHEDPFYWSGYVLIGSGK